MRKRMKLKRIWVDSPLRRARRRRMQTLVEAADELGVSAGTLSRWETAVTPGLPDALRIVHLYPELSLYDLLRGGDR